MAQPKFFLQPLTAAICVACYSGSIQAQQIDTEDNVQQLAPVVMTAQKANDANGLIVRADPKQPIQPVPATDGADYLQSIAGFSSVKNGGTNGDVTFRGMFGSRIKILTDGTENLGACPSRMDAPTSYIQPESFDRITVTKGPQTVQYANTGSAATVIFERQKPKLSEDQSYFGQASVLLGSYGRLDQNIEAVAGDEQKYIRLNANRSESNSYEDGNGDKVPSAWERWNTDLALGWTPDANTWLELSAGKSDGEALYAGRDMDGSQFARESLGLRFEKKNLTDVIKKVEGQVNYSYNDHVMDNFRLRTPPLMEMDHGDMDMHHGSMKGPSEMQVTRRTLNSRLAVTSEWDKLSLITGVDSQRNKHGGDMVSPNMNVPFSHDKRFQSYGGFAELTYIINPQNKIVTGTRVDAVQIDDLKTHQDRSETLPSGFIRLENKNLNYDLKSYIGLGYVERVPDYWELRTYYQVEENSSFNHLKNEKTVQLDLGTQFKHEQWNAWASAYVGLIQDYILMNYVEKKSGMSDMHMEHDMGGMGHSTMHGTEDKKQMTTLSSNIDATIAGAEAGIGYDFTDAIQADVSAMYAWGENTDTHKPLPQIAPLEGRLNVRYVQDKYTFGLLWRVVAKQDRISLHQGNIVGYDMNESKSFNTLALNASYNLAKDINIAVGVDNVFDKAYTEHLNKAGSSDFGFASEEQFNNIGRNYWARMSMKF
ncbi:TonB-dependent copper receptor [Acinetobacter sp. R933-2]|uniref:TonB-dependent copper receptor n=1 Tax=Acinetobacter sp. R933-2 TaxID=2746728 RepID=UPI0025781F7D|nr:TonB-dependent copper receptor [Acinetobacter sp. R933-2]MDM1248617.1 TonB-dependent copper receptor [Acinetobacter sp. R933-2]